MLPHMNEAAEEEEAQVVACWVEGRKRGGSVGRREMTPMAILLCLSLSPFLCLTPPLSSIIFFYLSLVLYYSFHISSSLSASICCLVSPFTTLCEIGRVSCRERV